MLPKEVLEEMDAATFPWNRTRRNFKVKYEQRERVAKAQDSNDRSQSTSLWNMVLTSTIMAATSSMDLFLIELVWVMDKPRRLPRRPKSTKNRPQKPRGVPDAAKANRTVSSRLSSPRSSSVSSMVAALNHLASQSSNYQAAVQNADEPLLLAESEIVNVASGELILSSDLDTIESPVRLATAKGKAKAKQVSELESLGKAKIKAPVDAGQSRSLKDAADRVRSHAGPDLALPRLNEERKANLKRSHTAGYNGAEADGRGSNKKQKSEEGGSSKYVNSTWDMITTNFEAKDKPIAPQVRNSTKPRIKDGGPGMC